MSFPVKIFLSRYLMGLSDRDYECRGVDCTISETHYLFWHGTFTAAQVIGRIPRNSVYQITVEDKSVVQKRLTTVTRLALLGPFALAFPKRRKIEEYCVIIDWEDTNGARRQAVFEFSGSRSAADARLAANELIKYQLPRLSGAAADEYSCPYCAEIIKKAAKICRFCRSSLE